MASDPHACAVGVVTDEPGACVPAISTKTVDLSDRSGPSSDEPKELKVHVPEQEASNQIKWTGTVEPFDQICAHGTSIYCEMDVWFVPVGSTFWLEIPISVGSTVIFSVDSICYG